ncbi:MAG: basic secretory protein-like protein [Marinagarivorans sp.]
MTTKLEALFRCVKKSFQVRSWWLITVFLIAVNGWALDAPVNLKAYAGGGNVILVWPRSVPPENKTIYYKIYRNDVVISWYVKNVAQEAPVVTFVDTAPPASGAVNYSVSIKTTQTNEESPKSTNATVTMPAVDVPIPDVMLDVAGVPSAYEYLTKLKAALQLWYPKIAVLIAAPHYMPPKTIGLRIDSGDCKYSMAVGDDTWINVCAKHAAFRGNEINHDDINVIVHEGTHLIQSYFSGVPSVDEGIATWAGDLTEQKFRAIPGGEMSFLNGYEYSAAFFSWIMNRYPNSNLVRNLNIQAHDQIMDYGWFADATGKKVNQLWQEMTNVEMSPPQPMLHGTGLCAQVLGEGEPSIQYGLASRCANVNSQTFVYEPVAQRLRVEAGCLSVGAQSRIRVVGCSDASVGRWSFESVPQYAGKQWGQWRLGGSNKCLQLESIPESIDKTSPRLIADECDSQKWAQVWRPFSA